MAEIVASALLPIIFENLASEAVKKVVRSKRIISELDNLKRTLLQVQALLNDASHKEIRDEAVKLWLNSLQHLAYDIDDILDGLATDAMEREFTQESGSITSNVRKIVPTFYSNFKLDNMLRHKLVRITTKLQDLEKEKDRIGLIVKNERPTNINRKFQTCLVDVSSIVGRQGEKEALVRKLLGNQPSNQNFSVVPIVGMGGIGKTTLARLLYDEKQVKDHFELMAWVCVSDDFDSFNISKSIFQSVTGENKDFADLNLLQVALRDQLTGKRFLLVLDDVWSESYEDWKILVGPFHGCALGSKIIMTTRKEHLLKKLGCDSLNPLQRLSHDDAMCLFAHHALDLGNYDSHPTLEPLGEGVVKKCDGLPLALIAIGRLLRTKAYEEESWKDVLNNEIWTSQDEGGIVPALTLSYHDLSACLKQLFAYCSLFPKDYMFDKEDLIFLWMAEGFLHQSSRNKSKEERLGHEYFDELLSRSFFQHAPNDESLYVMHDLMNDLAKYISGDIFVRLDKEMENDTRKESLEKYRHMSFVREEYEAYKKFEAFRIAKNLRTFLGVSIGVKEWWQNFYLSNKILDDLLTELPLLRVLCLSGYEIREVPDSIGSLKHLRYLNLSQTSVKTLPENVGNLYNLQTLILFGCNDLIKLPKSFIKLKNLRHFDVRNTPSLNKMPLGLGELKSLQTLSKIIIGDDNGFEITELKGLKDLCGKISIEGLDKVPNEIHARETNILHKGFSELQLEWSDVFDGSRKETLEMKVLNELKPCNDSLKQLKVVSYGGTMLPNWVGDPSFHRLKHVSIRGCKSCINLPPLGQLDSLKELFIGGLEGVKFVGSELLGTSVSFCSLKILSFEDMQGWKEWSTNGGVVFPCLEELCINKCPNLDVISVEKLPSLRVLKLNRCGDGVLRSLVHVASPVTKMEIKSIIGLTDEVWGGVMEDLGGVEELIIKDCNEIQYLWESEAKASAVLVNLRKLEVLECKKLVSLGEKEEEEDNGMMMTSLRRLVIWGCESIECCNCPNSVETLAIVDCDSMTAISFSKGGGGEKLKSLEIIGCSTLLEKEFGGGEKNSTSIYTTSMPMLEDVVISGWINLKSIIDLNCYPHLTRLTISNCSRLESFPEHQLSNLTSLTHLEITDCKSLESFPEHQLSNLTSLTHLEITDCKSLESFPEHQLSNLTSLTLLVIYNCPSMDASFPSSGVVWPPKLQSLKIGLLKKPMSEWGPQKFPTSLVNLNLYGGSRSTEGKEEDVNDISKLSHLLPSSLTTLKIYYFHKLKRVSKGLQHLTSLQYLKIDDCPNVEDLPVVKTHDFPELSKGRSHWASIKKTKPPAAGTNRFCFGSLLDFIEYRKRKSDLFLARDRHHTQQSRGLKQIFNSID